MTNEQVQLNKDLLEWTKANLAIRMKKYDKAWFKFTKRRHAEKIESLLDLVKQIEYQLHGIPKNFTGYSVPK
jgi:hypothetical protein